MNKSNSIIIWTDSGSSKTKAALPMPEVTALSKVAMKPEALAERFNDFMVSLEPVLLNCPDNISGFEVDQLEFNLVINASGGFELVGKLNAGIETSVKVVLKRK